MAKHLFLASTPFNVLTAAMVALELPHGDTAELGLIDQTDTTQTFRQALQNWQGTPFARTEVLSSKATGSGKRQQRQLSFKWIQQRLTDLQPDWIYTGNDRRIEFQFAMAHSHARGVYLDDGTYSYLGRKTHWLKDRILDNIAKKVAYGWWWKQPATIGASDWIDHSVLAFPEFALPALKKRPCLTLPDNLQRPEFAELARICLGKTDTAIDQLQGLLLLPHSSVISPMQKVLGEWLDHSGNSIGYKHHPRTEQALTTAEQMTSLWHIPLRAIAVPASTPMEILLPLLSPHCKIAGDVSTALLTAKWLRPELQVSALISPDTSAEWTSLLKQLGIECNTLPANPDCNS
ncbi:hypothetical protein [Thalassolituus marinus]|uniref:Uncharacterized protein n=1 Tax=Thalassolituus marinus TaxID=671053 RepID=A0ABS7ZRT8_9GAMM|nr:hypothetical protein [Thalassolituus marinus]MCA6063125.1 hypothetical protein [Thalassolituus marinus]